MTITTRPTTLARQLDMNRTKSQSFWARALRTLWYDRLTMVAIVVLVVLTVICVVGPTILANNFNLDPTHTNILEKYMKPGEGTHLLGTDNLGRDQLARLTAGGQISLSIAYFASLLSIAIGVTLGIAVGYYGGVIDDIFIWLIATLTAIPSIFLLLIAASLWSPSPPVLITILALLSWVDVARLVRGRGVLAARKGLRHGCPLDGCLSPPHYDGSSAAESAADCDREPCD
jgi:peptide/nickel transport system permease protein